jgi:hypothetical protein
MMELPLKKFENYYINTVIPNFNSAYPGTKYI